MTKPANSFDVAIIGGGHNGLVAAALLSKAGRRVVVCEALPHFGSASQTSTLMPGMRVPQCAHVVTGFPASLIRKLKLKRHGLKVLQKNMPRVALDPDGRHIPLGSSSKTTTEAIFHWSSRDAEAWKRFSTRLDALTAALLPLYTGNAPELVPAAFDDKLSWLRLYARERRRGRASFQNLLKQMPSNVADFLDLALETDLLKGALALEASLGSYHGPSAPGSMFYWAWQRASEASSRSGTLQVVGGPAALTDALTSAAASTDADLRVAAPVASIRIENDAAVGLVLENGDEISAPCIISTVSPKTTFLNLVGARQLDTGLVLDLENIRMRGASAKVNLALKQLPTFAKADEALLSGRLLLAPSLMDVERASNGQKYAELPHLPVMEVTLPSVLDESLTPEGRHVLSAVIPFVPFDVEGGWDAAKDKLTSQVIKTLGDYAPDLPDLIMAHETLTPPEIEARCGIEKADWHQGEIAFDQALMMRPVPQLANNRGPLKGLIAGGAGAHPGGGLTGRPALNAVDAALHFTKEQRR